MSMIRDFGNGGNYLKRLRVMEAIKCAKENKCAMNIILDPLVYTAGTIRFGAGETAVCEFTCDQDTLYVSRKGSVLTKIPWWDIDRVVLIW